MLPSDLEGGGAPANQPTPVEWAFFALAAVRRRVVLFVAIVLVGLAATIGYYLMKPPIYRVEAKILAQRPNALSSVVRSVNDDAPSRSAWEMFHRHDNLVALVRETKLDVALAERRPQGSGSFLSRLRAKGAREPEDPVEAAVLVLDRRLTVLTEEGTITIQLDWPDAVQAYQVVQAALHNFLEARHLQEVTAIDEVISVLQGRASALRKQLEDASEQARARPSRAPRVAARPRAPSEELVRMQSMIDAKQRAIRDVEEFRLRRLADAQAQLDQTRTALSDAHPTVISLRKDIEALSRETPQTEGLREQQAKLAKDYAERAAREGFSGALPATTAAPAPFEPESQEEDQRVRELRLQYEQISERITGAQVDLDAARAAFKYRYNVIWPPQLPREPYGPNLRKILLLGGFATFMLALAAAVGPDLWAGRIVQRWQVERSLGLTVLGEIVRRP